MADQIPMIIGDERVASDESIDPLPFRRVHRGHGRQGRREAPRPGGRHCRRTAPRRALAAHSGPPCSIAARLLAERVEEFATVISAEAAKPIKTARVEAARAVNTVSSSAAVARTLGGELIPLDASSAGEGKVAGSSGCP